MRKTLEFSGLALNRQNIIAEAAGQSVRCRRPHRFRKVSDRQMGAIGEYESTFDNVLQFPDVPGPRVGQQHLHGGGLNSLHLDSQSF